MQYNTVKLSVHPYMTANGYHVQQPALLIIGREILDPLKSVLEDKQCACFVFKTINFYNLIAKYIMYCMQVKFTHTNF